MVASTENVSGNKSKQRTQVINTIVFINTKQTTKHYAQHKNFAILTQVSKSIRALRSSSNLTTFFLYHADAIISAVSPLCIQTKMTVTLSLVIYHYYISLDCSI